MVTRNRRGWSKQDLTPHIQEVGFCPDDEVSKGILGREGIRFRKTAWLLGDGTGQRQKTGRLVGGQRPSEKILVS